MSRALILLLIILLGHTNTCYKGICKQHATNKKQRVKKEVHNK